MGDTTFELSYIGGMHSASDIAVWIPEHGLLMTGDTMADVWLTDTPGCLASFIARPGVKHDFPKLLKNWNELLAKKDDIDVLVPGHWNGELTFAGFENRVNYVAAVWETVNREAKAGTNMQDVVAANGFADTFPELVDSPGCNAGNHNTTVIEMYATVTDQESAAMALYDLIEAGANEKKIRKVVAHFDAEKPDYYFLESQINGWGYRFMWNEKYAEAARLFRINVELYPESWNVYDSLGEALHSAGNLPEAEAMYAKSLELNPESPTGEEALRKIRQEMSVN
jgi:tetratricopeptide (TPR) repeat protein